MRLNLHPDARWEYQMKWWKRLAGFAAGRALGAGDVAQAQAFSIDGGTLDVMVAERKAQGVAALKRQGRELLAVGPFGAVRIDLGGIDQERVPIEEIRFFFYEKEPPQVGPRGERRLEAMASIESARFPGEEGVWLDARGQRIEEGFICAQWPCDDRGNAAAPRFRERVDGLETLPSGGSLEVTWTFPSIELTGATVSAEGVRVSAKEGEFNVAWELLSPAASDALETGRLVVRGCGEGSIEVSAKR